MVVDGQGGSVASLAASLKIPVGLGGPPPNRERPRSTVVLHPEAGSSTVVDTELDVVDRDANLLKSDTGQWQRADGEGHL